MEGGSPSQEPGQRTVVQVGMGMVGVVLACVAMMGARLVGVGVLVALVAVEGWGGMAHPLPHLPPSNSWPLAHSPHPSPEGSILAVARATSTMVALRGMGMMGVAWRVARHPMLPT